MERVSFFIKDWCNCIRVDIFRKTIETFRIMVIFVCLSVSNLSSVENIVKLFVEGTVF